MSDKLDPMTMERFLALIEQNGGEGSLERLFPPDKPTEFEEWEPIDGLFVGAERPAQGPMMIFIEDTDANRELLMSPAEARKLVRTLEQALRWVDKRRGS